MIVENISVLIFLIVIVILGIINAAYLVISNYRKKPIVCPINHECNEVIRGKWSRIFYVRNDFIGLLFYIFLLIGIILTIITNKYNELISLVSLSAASLAFLFSIFLTSIQLFVIRKKCFYCLTSALINLLIFFILVSN